MDHLSIRDVSFEGKTALVRVDYNVPIEGGKITDDTRIRETLPTIRELVAKGAKVVLMSHLGRPKGGPDPKYSLAPVAARLQELLGLPVTFVNDITGPHVQNAVKALAAGAVALIENVRFHPGEEKNDPAFSRELAKLGDVYVNDAFGSAHRAHCSTEGVARLMSAAVAGLLMDREIEALSSVTVNPKRPLVAIIGGSKISTKLAVFENLVGIVDRLLVGGAMAFTFFRAQGLGTGKSLVEEDQIATAKEILAVALSKKCEIVLPLDFVCAAEPKSEAARETHPSSALPAGQAGYDIGPKTVERFVGALADAKTVVWNGPMGMFEVAGFEVGTQQIGMALAALRHAKTVVGGGDSVAALGKLGLLGAVSHVSTGGGASLEFLEGKTLPGIAALSKKATAPAAGSGAAS